MELFKVFGERQNLHVFSLCDCLLASMAAVQAEDVRASCRVLLPRTVTLLQPLTSQLSPVAISWLSAQPMHVVEHLTS